MTSRSRRHPAPRRRRPVPVLVAAPVAALVGVLVGVLLVAAGPAGATVASSEDPGADRAAVASGGWSCTGDLAGATGTPVLLVHGVGLGAEENWRTTLEPFLLDRGHPVCLVALPSYATRDVQATIDVVVRAIRGVHDAAGRRIDVVGHSLGAYLPRAALRLRPDLARLVDDVVGLAGVYDVGSERLVERCTGACVPALHQLATDSALLRAVARRPLPAGPSYTGIGSRGDASVTPQPRANQQDGSTAVMLQDVCPGRTLDGRDHALLVGDAVAAALLVDALDHPGPTDATRVPAGTCDQDWYAGFDPDAFLSVVARTATRTANGRVAGEPALGCRLRPDCTDLAARGRLLRDVDWQVSRYRVVLRATAAKDGTARLAMGSRVTDVTVRAGEPVVISAVRPGRATAAFTQTRPRYYTAWVAEDRRSLG